MAKLDYACDGDEDQRKHLGIGEVILDQGGSLDTGAVDEAEEAEAGSGQDPHRVWGWLTIREERFQDVQGKCEALYGSNTWSQDDALYPESNHRHHSNVRSLFKCSILSSNCSNYE